MQIIEGDCLKKLRYIPENSVDAIITDPPYGIDYQSQRRQDKKKWKAKIDNDKSPFIWFLPEAFRVLKEGGGCYVLRGTIQNTSSD